MSRAIAKGHTILRLLSLVGMAALVSGLLIGAVDLVAGWLGHRWTTDHQAGSFGIAPYPLATLSASFLLYGGAASLAFGGLRAVLQRKFAPNEMIRMGRMSWIVYVVLTLATGVVGYFAIFFLAALSGTGFLQSLSLIGVFLLVLVQVLTGASPEELPKE